MGKLTRSQRKGKGTPSYRRPSHRFFTRLTYRKFDEQERDGVLSGEIIGFIDDVARTPLLMHVKMDNGENIFVIAPEGAMIGATFQQGSDAELVFGNVLPLSKIPDGFPVFNVEAYPGSGGKYIRSAGTNGSVVSHEGKDIGVLMPSKKTKYFDQNCRAQVGIICGGGRLEKPLMTAGKNFHKMGAKNMQWPKVRGVAMNPVSHPHGGSQHHAGKSTCVARTTPPGRKVGHIAARSTGRRKSRRKR